MNYWLIMIPIGLIFVALSHLFIGEDLQRVGVGFGFLLSIIGFIKAYKYKTKEETVGE